jgi:hypothetical protein
MSKKYKDDQVALPDYQDLTIEGYIRKYYIDPSPDNGMNYPRVILERLEFMGDKSPIEFWMWLLELPKDGEFKQKKGRRLVWGYVDRLAICAAKFIELDDESRNYILRARNQEKPIWWRGDGMDVSKFIARETYRYNQMDDDEKLKYRRSAMKQARAVMVGNAR